MVDDNEIVKDQRLLTQRATSLFIKENTTQNAPPQLYDLDKEFAATKNNKNSSIIISLVIFILVFGFAAFAVTKYIEYQNSLIPISINAFDDVNLREIFDKAKQYEKQMSDAVRNREDLYRKRDASALQITEDSNNAVKIIEEDNLGNKQGRIKIVKLDFDNKLKTDQEFWQSELTKLEESIAAIQTNIDSYDTRIVEKAKEQEELINNQQKRFDLEMEKSVNYYEEKIKELNETHARQIDDISLNNKEIIATIKEKNNSVLKNLEDKYNPVFGDDYSYLNISESESKPFNFNGRVNELLYSEGLLNKKNISDKIDNIFITEKTFSKLKEIPYYNSPQKAILYLEQSYHESIGELWDLIKNIPPVLKSKNNLITNQNTELEQLNYFLKSYIKSNRINGLIIDPRSPRIKIYMDDIYKIKTGNIGYVYRNDSDYLGTVKFKYNNGILEAEMLDLVDKQRKLEPFDMILINLK